MLGDQRVNVTCKRGESCWRICPISGVGPANSKDRGIVKHRGLLTAMETAVGNASLVNSRLFRPEMARGARPSRRWTLISHLKLRVVWSPRERAALAVRPMRDATKRHLAPTLFPLVAPPLVLVIVTVVVPPHPDERFRRNSGAPLFRGTCLARGFNYEFSVQFGREFGRKFRIKGGDGEQACARGNCSKMARREKWISRLVTVSMVNNCYDGSKIVSTGGKYRGRDSPLFPSSKFDKKKEKKFEKKGR